MTTLIAIKIMESVVVDKSTNFNHHIDNNNNCYDEYEL